MAETTTSTVRRELSLEDTLRTFQYHTVTRETADKMAVIREQYYRLATTVVTTLPYTRERSLALTHLEESSMRAIQCLALTEGTPIPIGEMRDGNTAAP